MRFSDETRLPRAPQHRLDDADGVKSSVALLRSRRQMRDFLPEELLQLTCYVIPEPDPLESAREMATLLETSFLPETERARTQRVK